MSNNHDEITANLDEERLLVQLKNVQYENAGKGKLLLTSKRLVFENKNGLFSSPHQAFSLDLSMISSAEINKSSNTLILEWLNEDSEYMVTQLSLPNGDAATSLCRFLNDTLELLRNEAELQERKACYQAFLWNTAYLVWGIAEMLLQIVRELTHEDWDGVDTSLTQVSEIANALAINGAMDITDQVQTLTGTGPSRDAVSVLQEMIATMNAIGTSLHSEFPLNEKWSDLVFDDSPGLNWRDLRYIFLFAGRYKLLPLWQQSGETEKIEDSLSRLVTLSSILENKIPHVEAIDELPLPSEEEESPSMADSVDALAQNIEASLTINAGIA